MSELPEPFDPYCNRYAYEIVSYDFFWAESPEEFEAVKVKDRGEKRVNYVRDHESNYNPENGHFACDRCIIKFGIPVDADWKVK